MRPLQAELALQEQAGGSGWGPGCGFVPIYPAEGAAQGQDAMGWSPLHRDLSASQNQAEVAGGPLGEARLQAQGLALSDSGAGPGVSPLRIPRAGRWSPAQTQLPLSPDLGGWAGVPRTHGRIVGRPGEEEPLKALGVLRVQAVEQIARLLGVQQRQHGPVVVLVPAAHQLPRGTQHELLWGQRPGEPRSSHLLSPPRTADLLGGGSDLRATPPPSPGARKSLKEEAT